MQKAKSHSVWHVNIKAGGSVTTRDGSIISNKGDKTVHLIVQVPVKMTVDLEGIARDEVSKTEG